MKPFQLRSREAPAKQQQSAPSSESLVGFLVACSEQTASFPWHGYPAHISQLLGVRHGNDSIMPRQQSPPDTRPESNAGSNDYYSLSIFLLTASLSMLAAKIIQGQYNVYRWQQRMLQHDSVGVLCHRADC